ncbi:cation transporter [Pseudomonas sp. RIT-PI-AD]|uniref:heavy-metal-associated domain-containing protein n=1 Tax=Pseudomonas sp. RIT-PI-AD TaxID=3035294 RepID=UPI0021DADF34|nr:cation transporter [Pseudomonas sp. RIT-PI-AD]
MQTFKVQGISCGHCVRSITQAIQALEPSAQVQVDIAGGEVKVESALSAERIVAAISAEGYPARAA